MGLAKGSIALVLLAILLETSAGPARAAIGSGATTIPVDVHDGSSGGVGLTGAAFTLSGIFGQAGARPKQGGAFTLGGGFYSSVAGLSAAVAAPPTVSLLAPSGPGFESEIDSSVPIIGSIGGPGLRTWRLDFAPGVNATGGFTAISTGSLAESSGILGVWNAHALAGWQTLRLSATNAAGRSSSVSEDVYVGDPSRLLELSKGLKLPSGVAVGASGLIYAADTGSDRVDVFNAQGALQATFGGNDDRRHPPLILRAPEGIATDVFGNIFVADTGDRRALKLTSMGQPLLEIPIPGKPVGIAVDAMGNIYVSDPDGAQILKFNQGGNKIQTFALPGGKPSGIALDSFGDLFAADPRKHRLVEFNPAGTLINEFGPGLDLQRPYGVAVSNNANCIVVSDMARDRVLSLDGFGKPMLSFGGPHSGLSGPRGLAFDSAGELYLADRARSRVLKLGPPPPGAAPTPLADQVPILEQDDAFIIAAAGGQLQRADHAALIVPPGALAEDLDLSLSTPTARLAIEEALKSRKLDGDGLVSVSTGVAFGPDGTTFATAVEVIVPYDPALVTALGILEPALKLYWWNPDRQDWFWVPARVDLTTKTLHGRATRLAVYKVVAPKDGK